MIWFGCFINNFNNKLSILYAPDRMTNEYKIEKDIT